MAKKKIKTSFKINLSAGEATPAPPVGPVLGQHGINIVEFCRQYNEKTSKDKGFIIPATVTVYEDRSFTFELRTPPTTDLLRKAVNVSKGSAKPNKDKIGSITRDQLEEIAKKKMSDLNTNNLDAAIKIIAGTAHNMGIEVKS